MFDLSISLVLYKSDPVLIEKIIQSIFQSRLKVRLFLIDNSPTDDLRKLKVNDRVEYIFNDRNLGFGKAHNLILAKTVEQDRYHLILNPDVLFEAGVLDELKNFMDSRPEVGLVLPKVLDFESQIQFVCKRLPSPSDLFLRRFGSKILNVLLRNQSVRYEMRDKDHNLSFEAPSMSGCFMFIRLECLKKIGLFDERFFMYLEDVDLSRRMYLNFKNVYYPGVHVFHGHARESYKINKLLFTHVFSAIKYFNKWGWFFDRERKEINSKV